MDKKQLRGDYLARRQQLSDSRWRRLSDEVCAHVVSAAWFNNAATLLAYMPFRREVDVRPVVEQSWALGKRVFLPKVDPENKRMFPYLVRSYDDLKPGAYGILEPDPTRTPFGHLDALDLVFVPGVVFDRNGYRIGYGGGYYDRFLLRLPAGTYTVGVAFSFQVTEFIPREAYDQPLDALVTDKGVVVFK